jgi:hypothetical protein
MENKHREFSIFWPVLLIAVGTVLFLNNIGSISGTTFETLVKLWPLLFIIGGIDGLINRHGFVGPVLGIGLGIIFLLGNFGYLTISAWEIILRFWPVFLIAWGLDLIIGRKSLFSSLAGLLVGAALVAGIYYLSTQSPVHKENFETNSMKVSLEGATSAEGSISLPAGEVSLQGGADPLNLLEGQVSTTDESHVSSDIVGEKATFDIEDNTRGVFTPFVGSATNLTWDYRLNSSIPFDLDMSIGAGDYLLDLTKVNVDDLNVDAGVGRIKLILPSGDALKADLSVAVGEVIVMLPKGTPIRIHFDTALTVRDLPEGFNVVDDVVSTSGAASADDLVELEISVPVGHITVQYLP